MVRRHKPREAGKLVRVAPTSVGRGLFAARGIRRNEQIGEFRGLLIRDPDYSSEYCLDMGGGQFLEPDPPFRFINHSCDPNCELCFFDDPACDSERVWLYALVDIPSNTELTIDYNWPAEGAIPCACGSPLCRGWVVGEDDLPRLLEMLAKGDM